MKWLASVALWCSLWSSGLVLAQSNAIPTDKLGLDIAAPDAATATAYVWRAYMDGSATATVLTGGTCAGTAPTIACQFPIPATFPAGSHTYTVSAANAAGEGPKSLGFTFVLTKVPSQPVSLRIVVVP